MPFSSGNKLAAQGTAVCFITSSVLGYSKETQSATNNVVRPVVKVGMQDQVTLYFLS
jgi:hypothetical protein